LAYGNKDSALKVFDLKSGREIHKFQNEVGGKTGLYSLNVMCPDIPFRVLLTSDNKFVIALFNDSIGVFSLEEKKQIYRIKGSGIIG